MGYLVYILAVAAGVSIPVQSAANSALDKGVGQAGAVLLIVYGVALLGSLESLPVLGLSLGAAFEKASALPSWAYVGGLCNLLFVIVAATTTRKIGFAAFTVITLVSAVILSVALDHFGLLGFPRHEAGLLRLAGAILATGGVALVLIF